MLTTGATLDGRYEIGELLAAGGMGEVYRARRVLLGDEVVIKVIRTTGGDAERMRERFMSESRLCAKLRHPNIVTILDFAITGDGQPYLVMEYLNGPSLRDLIAAGGTSYLNELMRIAGGENVFQDAATGYAKIGLEEILARNPDVIVDMGEMAQTVGITDRQKQAVAALWRRYPTLRAVRNNQVFAVASDIFVVPGPRVTEAAGELARMLHPEAAP